MSGESIFASPSKDAAVALLQMANLPASDLTNAHMQDFFYCGDATAPKALVGVEFCGSSALLRSLVVSPDFRGRGLGSRLVRHIENLARERGVRSVYLLTTDAGSFFERCGYAVAERVSAPAGIRATREFSELCPTDCTFLIKRLSDTT